MNLLSLMVFIYLITEKTQRHGLRVKVLQTDASCWAIWCLMKLSFCSQGFNSGAAEQICLLDCLDYNVAETWVKRYSRKMRIEEGGDGKNGCEEVNEILF